MFKDIARRIEALFITRPKSPESTSAQTEPASRPAQQPSAPPAAEPRQQESPAQPLAQPAPTRLEAPTPTAPSRPEAPTPAHPPRDPALDETEEAPVRAVRRPQRRQRPPPPQRKRLYHLGVDWGTSSTKMVLRDYGGRDDSHDHGRAYVIRHANRAFRYPSTVKYWRGAMWFGHQAECRGGECLSWTSLKARTAVERGWDDMAIGLPGMTLEDLATISVAHYTKRGLDEAQRHARSKRAEVRLGMTLSVPVAELEIPQTQRAYLRVAAVGYHLAVRLQFDPQGKSPEEIKQALARAKQAVHPGLSNLDPTAFLRAEVAAAMMWPFKSPSVKEGPYTVVDIGAATTNASWFRIHSGRDEDDRHVPKASMTFFGAETLAPGMDGFDEVLAMLLGHDDPTALRGRENELLAKVNNTSKLDKVVGEYWETWHKAKRYAWRLAPRACHWEGTRVLVVGGGSKVALVDRAFEKPPSHTQAKIVGAQRLHDPGTPSDLYELPRAGGFAHPFSDEPTFLLVAYGLSFNDEDRPEICLPNEVAPFRAKLVERVQPSSEELGYDEK